jgi:hypothetical protein
MPSIGATVPTGDDRVLIGVLIPAMSGMGVATLIGVGMLLIGSIFD